MIYFPYRTYYRIIENANCVIKWGLKMLLRDASERDAAVGQATNYKSLGSFSNGFIIRSGVM